MNLEPTGERMIVEEYHSTAEDHLIYLMHIASYAFAEAFTRGKRVLDYGCGSGYGASRIAQTAVQVQAVDVAEDAIAHARERFGGPKLSFMQINPDAALPYDDAAFDVVLSFQVFEHVVNTSAYLSEVRRVLASGGHLILITPDRSTRLFPLQRPWNRWHWREYSQADLRQELEEYFSKVEVLAMSARADVINMEIRRCRKLKWLTLPFTLPVIPDRWRVALLNVLHRYSKRGTAVGPPRDYDFTIDDVHISRGATPSVNIVAVCTAP